MPRPYPAPHHHHVGPLFVGGIVAAAIVALLLPSVASAGDRNRSGYYNEEDARYYGGESVASPYLDDSYHRQYDRPTRYNRHYSYSKSYEREYNGNDYRCYCGRNAYYRVQNWKGEHEYRQARRSRGHAYSYRDDDRY